MWKEESVGKGAQEDPHQKKRFIVKSKMRCLIKINNMSGKHAAVEVDLLDENGKTKEFNCKPDSDNEDAKECKKEFDDCKKQVDECKLEFDECKEKADVCNLDVDVYKLKNTDELDYRTIPYLDHYSKQEIGWVEYDELKPEEIAKLTDDEKKTY